MSITSISLIRGTFTNECGSMVTNSTISTSAITNSSIDMNGNRITNVGTPINPFDAVNKNYIDTYPGNAAIYTVTLTGTVFSQVIPNTLGSFKISVKSIIPNGPCAQFTAVKNSTSISKNCPRSDSSAGLVTGERLLLKWEINQGIFIRKTGLNYDGNYQIIVVSS